MNDGTSNWTPERIERLKQLHADGYSGSQIAAALGGLTRNAVIGKAHRLGLKREGASAPSIAAPYPKREAPKGQRRGTPQLRTIRWADEPPVPSKPLPVVASDVLSPNKAHWLDREPRQCAYFVDGTSGADAIACCNPTCGKTYCPGHRALTTRADQPRPLTGRDAGIAGNDFRRTPRPKSDDRFSSWLKAS